MIVVKNMLEKLKTTGCLVKRVKFKKEIKLKNFLEDPSVVSKKINRKPL